MKFGDQLDMGTADLHFHPIIPKPKPQTNGVGCTYEYLLKQTDRCFYILHKN